MPWVKSGLPNPTTAGVTAPFAGATPGAESEEQQFAPPEKNVSRFRDFFTGENRTEFPGTPEFLKAYGEGATVENPADLGPVMTSAISSNPKAQLDILRKKIPGLEARPDKYGNVMVRAPGMKEFAYLNKPGASQRDLDEFGTQTLATLPLLGMGGAGTGALGKAAYGALGVGSGSVAEDAMAVAAGSEQGIDPTKAVVSAALGGLGAGVVEPILGKAGQAVAKTLGFPGSRIRAAVNPDAEASRRITGAARDDLRAGTAGMTSSQVATARARGQDPRVIDVGGETLRAEARRAANIAPAGRKEFTDFVDDRFLGQGQRYTDFISQLVRRQNTPGLAPNAYATREALENAARTSTKARYDPAYKAGAKGLMTPQLQRLQTAPAIQRAMRAANTEMKNRSAAQRGTGAYGPNGQPTLEYWDLVKRRLDDRIKTLKQSGARSEALDLDSLRVQLLKQLDNMVPEYAVARGTAETFFKARDALEAGEKFVKGAFDLNQTRAALNKMTTAERDLFAEGFASRYIETVSKVGDRRSILNAVNASRDSRERLNIALGANRARAVESFLRSEELMDLARRALGNSTTARQLVELGLTGYGLYTNDPNTLMLAALSFGSRSIGRTIDRRVAERVIQQLLSPDTATFMAGVKQISSTPILDALRAFDRAVQKAGIGRTSATGAGGDALTTPEIPTIEPAAPSLPPGVPQVAPPSAAPGSPPSGAPRLPPPDRGLPTPPGGSVERKNNDLRAENNGLEDVYRSARDAIAQGADPIAVNERLVRYGLEPIGVG